MTPREYAYGGIFGALALVMPFFFHLLHLGPLFLPMYLPLVALAFFVRPGVSVLTAVIVPILSGCLTGMPALYPPIAPIKSIELGLMALAIGLLPKKHPLAVLVPVLALGRLVNVGLFYVAAKWLDLPAGFVAGASFLAGWPGIVLLLIVIPPVVKAVRRPMSCL